MSHLASNSPLCLRSQWARSADCHHLCRILHDLSQRLLPPEPALRRLLSEIVAQFLWPSPWLLVGATHALQSQLCIMDAWSGERMDQHANIMQCNKRLRSGSEDADDILSILAAVSKAHSAIARGFIRQRSFLHVPDDLMTAWEKDNQRKEASKWQHEDVRRISALAVSPYGECLAMAETNGDLILFDLCTLAKVRSVKLTWVYRPGYRHSDADDYIASMEFAPHGRTLVTTDGHRVRVWDAASLQLLKFQYVGTDSYDLRAAFQPNTLNIVVMAEGRVWLLDAKTLEVSWHATPHDLAKHACVGHSFSPDGKWLAVGGAQLEDGKRPLNLLDAGSFELQESSNSVFDAIASIAFSPNAKVISVVNVYFQFWIVDCCSLSILWEVQHRALGTLSLRANQCAVAHLHVPWLVDTGKGQQHTQPALEHRSSIFRKSTIG